MKKITRLPYNVRYDKHLYPGAKVLYSEIESSSRSGGSALTKSSQWVYMSPIEYAKLFGASWATIYRWLENLWEYDYIEKVVEGRGSQSKTYVKVKD